MTQQLATEHGLGSSDTKLRLSHVYTNTIYHRLYGRRFLQVKRPNQQYQSIWGTATKDQSNNESNKIHICTDNNP